MRRECDVIAASRLVTISSNSVKTRPYQQQCQSNIVECYKYNDSFDNVACCFDIVDGVDGALAAGAFNSTTLFEHSSTVIIMLLLLIARCNHRHKPVPYILANVTTLRSQHAIAIPSVVCRLSVCRLSMSSVTLVRPTQAVEIFRIFFTIR